MAEKNALEQNIRDSLAAQSQDNSVTSGDSPSSGYFLLSGVPSNHLTNQFLVIPQG